MVKDHENVFVKFSEIWPGNFGAVLGKTTLTKKETQYTYSLRVICVCVLNLQLHQVRLCKLITEKCVYETKGFYPDPSSEQWKTKKEKTQEKSSDIIQILFSFI